MAGTQIRGGGKNETGNVSIIHNVQGIVGNVGFWLILRALRSQCSILQMGVH